MPAASVRVRQKRVRIVRHGTRPQRRVHFQREWEPVFCPEMQNREVSPRLDATRTEKCWRIPRRYHSLVASTALTLASTAIVSFGVTVKNVGLTLDTGLLWLAAWPVSAMIAVPLRLALTPLIDRCIAPLIAPPLPQSLSRAAPAPLIGRASPFQR